MTAALLLMDFQAGVVDRLGSADVVEAAGTALEAARRHGVPVVFVRVAFRPGLPEVSRRNKSFSALADRGGMGQDDPSTQVVEALAPQDTEVVVLKRRVSAFTGSDLEVVLRGLEVDHLVLSGIATSGVVLSTLREAADRDFRLTVLADACADADEEVHSVLTGKVFPRQADVTTVAAWVDTLA
ncbi:MAG: cysteine hydrolase [Nocardioides sp.]|nr:cysteine hydrolase [Nocardioides sp.]